MRKFHCAHHEDCTNLVLLVSRILASTRCFEENSRGRGGLTHSPALKSQVCIVLSAPILPPMRHIANKLAVQNFCQNVGKNQEKEPKTAEILSHTRPQFKTQIVYFMLFSPLDVQIFCCASSRAQLHREQGPHENPSDPRETFDGCGPRAPLYTTRSTDTIFLGGK